MTQNIMLKSQHSIFKKFLANSTIDGLKNISEAHNLCATIFWSFAFLLCLSLMFYFSTINIIKYFEYKSKTDLQFLSDYQSKFPAVSVCNTAALRSDRFQQLFIDYLYNRSLIQSNNYSQTIPPELFNEITSFLLSLVNDDSTVQVKLIELTYTLDIMLLSCMYNGQICNESNFIWFYSYEFGSCYTFNAKRINGTTNDLRMIRENGGVGQLDLQFYIHNQLYIDLIKGTSGIVTLVHDNQQMPQIENQGLQLEPNRKHILQYTKSQNSYLGSPYTPCTTKIRPDMSILFEKYGADYEYSQQICYVLCGQVFVYLQCNCTDPSIWNYNHIFVNNQVIKTKLCSNSSSCIQQAVIQFNMDTSIQNQYCSHCLQECTIVNYDIISSSIKVPTSWNYPLIKQQIESQFKNVTMPIDWSSNYKTYIDQNYVAVQVIKSTYNEKHYEQKPDKKIDELIADLGGQAVLWIGFSLIAIFEILDLIYQLVCHPCIQRQQQQKNQVQSTFQVATIELGINSSKIKKDMKNIEPDVETQTNKID